MVVEPKWVTYAKTVDAYVDNLYGEEIVIKPWQEGVYGDGGADLSRPSVEAVAIPMDKRAMPQGASAEFVSRAVESSFIASMRHEYIESSGMKRGDRMYWKWRNQTYVVAFVDQQSDDRHYVILNIVKDSP